jgi:hypothetical protein
MPKQQNWTNVTKRSAKQVILRNVQVTSKQPVNSAGVFFLWCALEKINSSCLAL